MTFRIALKTRPGERIIFFDDMELSEAMAICQDPIDNGEPSVINVEKSEEFTAAFRAELSREQDATSSAVILNPKDENRIVEVEADSLEDAIEIVRTDYAESQLEINQELTEEING